MKITNTKCHSFRKRSSFPASGRLMKSSALSPGSNPHLPALVWLQDRHPGRTAGRTNDRLRRQDTIWVLAGFRSALCIHLCFPQTLRRHHQTATLLITDLRHGVSKTSRCQSRSHPASRIPLWGSTSQRGRRLRSPLMGTSQKEMYHSAQDPRAQA